VGLVTVGLRKRIECTWNFIVEPQELLENIDHSQFDALAIPGGFEEKGYYEDAYDERFLKLIREFDKKGKAIAAICVAALPLAKSGILKGRRATTYHENKEIRRKQIREMGAIVIDQAVVTDKNIITSANPAAALDTAFCLLEQLTSKANLDQVKHYMGFNF